MMYVSGSCAGTLDRVRETGVINLGYVEGAAPFSWTGADRQPQGYSVNLCSEIAEGVRTQLGLGRLKTNWVLLTLQDRLHAVRDGRVDVDCSTTTWTLSRQKDVDFSLITFIDGATVLTKADSDIFRFADYKDKRIAVIRSTTTFDVLQQTLRRRSMPAEMISVSTRAEGLELLRSGKVDGLASDRIALIGMVAQEPGTEVFRLLDDDISIEQYALALPRGDHEFRLAVNRVIARLYRTGAIMPIYDRWFGALGRPSMLLHATYFLQSLAE
jgi:ABC-type amino acid transport substrate-binding protein